MKELLPAVFASLLLAHSPLRASDHDVRRDATRGALSDHDRARQALLADEILPLGTILERVEHAQPGQVMEVELEQKSTGWTYEIKLLQAQGRLLKLYVDARTGEILRIQQKAPKDKQERR